MAFSVVYFDLDVAEHITSCEIRITLHPLLSRCLCSHAVEAPVGKHNMLHAQILRWDQFTSLVHLEWPYTFFISSLGLPGQQLASSVLIIYVWCLHFYLRGTTCEFHLKASCISKIGEPSCVWDRVRKRTLVGLLYQQQLGISVRNSGSGFPAIKNKHIWS